MRGGGGGRRRREKEEGQGTRFYIEASSTRRRVGVPWQANLRASTAAGRRLMPHDRGPRCAWNRAARGSFPAQVARVASPAVEPGRWRILVSHLCA
ncbi:unnamed protein product [Lampetra fluviatilis]